MRVEPSLQRPILRGRYARLPALGGTRLGGRSWLGKNLTPPAECYPSESVMTHQEIRWPPDPKTVLDLQLPLTTPT